MWTRVAPGCFWVPATARTVAVAGRRKWRKGPAGPLRAGRGPRPADATGRSGERGRRRDERRTPTRRRVPAESSAREMFGEHRGQASGHRERALSGLRLGRTKRVHASLAASDLLGNGQGRKRRKSTADHEPGDLAPSQPSTAPDVRHRRRPAQSRRAERVRLRSERGGAAFRLGQLDVPAGERASSPARRRTETPCAAPRTGGALSGLGVFAQPVTSA